MRWLVLVVLLATVGVVAAMPMEHPHHFGMQNCTQNCTHEQLRLHNRTHICSVCNGTAKMEKNMMKANVEKRMIENRIREIRMRHKMTEMKIKIERARAMIETARMRYLEAKEKYMELRKRGLKDPETFRWAKRYISSGVNYVKAWLERLMVQVENSNMGASQKQMLMERIRNCLMALNESEMAVNSSTTPDQLRHAVMELRKTWNDVRIEIKSAVGQIIVTKLTTIVNKAEDVAMKLEAEMMAKNMSTSIINDCLQKLDLAKQKLEEANAKFEEMPNATDPNLLYLEGRRLLIEARDLIRQAFMDLRRAFMELGYTGHIFFGNETGELFVMGSGRADIRMTGLAVVVVNGSVTVTPAGAVISVVGMNGTNVNGTLTASGHGRLIVRGDNVKIDVNGNFMRIFVKGNGTAVLNGEGAYRVKKGPNFAIEEGTFGNVTIEFGVIE